MSVGHCNGRWPNPIGRMPARAGKATRPVCGWEGWSRQRRVILLRRQLKRPLAIVDRGDPAQPRLGFAEVGPDRQVWEYAALVTSLDSEILTLGQLYRDRADCENTFDELKNQWGWGGFTTHDLKRCRLLARSVGADLQLVEPVRAPRRSAASSGGDH